MPASCTFRRKAPDRTRREFPKEGRAYSSVVEHFVDIEGVTSSNLVTPTILHRRIGLTGARRRREKEKNMKVRNSLRSLKNRHRDCRVVRRKGRVYVINKTQRRFKARQG